MMLTLQQVAHIIGAALPVGAHPDRAITAISIDTRQLSAGQLFIAIKGDRVDGHDFLDQAMQQAAVAAIVSDPAVSRQTRLPCLLVEDTRRALAELACHHRAQMPAIRVGVTGSCGKTSTKRLLASAFSQQASTLSNARSFNNDIGVPLTLLRLRPDHCYAICEVGANHPGEIAKLTQWVRPHVAIITNAAAVHLEGFGDVSGVARAKAELFEGLESGGTAIINANDAYADFWKRAAAAQGARVMTFGQSAPAEVTANAVQLNGRAEATFQLRLPNGETAAIQLSLLGAHQVMNALATAAAAYSQGLTIQQIKAGLEAVSADQGRLVTKKAAACAAVLDDTYNANPSSTLAAMEVLLQYAQHASGPAVMVLGDMLELGAGADALHRQMGERACALGVDSLYAYGAHSRHAVDAFGDRAHHFDNQTDLIQALQAHVQKDAVVLVKGSRSMGMERVVDALTQGHDSTPPQ